MTRYTAILFLILCLFVGPTLAGSYYGVWRWPMLFFLAIFLIAGAKICLNKKGLAGFQIKVLFVTTISLCFQGLWMLFNRKFTFFENEVHQGVHKVWQLEPNLDQVAPSLPGGIDFYQAVDRLSSILPSLLALFFIAVLVRRNKLSPKVIIITIFWTGVLVALLGITQRFMGAKGTFWSDTFNFDGRNLFFGTYRSPGIACCYLNLCLALGLSYLLVTTRKALQLRKRSPVPSLCISLGVLIICSGSILAGSKAGLVFTFLTIIIWSVWNFSSVWKTLMNSTSLLPDNNPRERNFIIGTCGIIFVVTLLAVAGTVMNRWDASIESDYQTLQYRGLINQVQYEMISDPDWGAYGFGAGSFAILFPFYKNEVPGLERANTFYSHNDHLQMLVEWGWFGTSCFYLILIGGILLLLRNIISKRKSKRGKSDTIYSKGIVVAFIIISLHAFVDFPYQIESIAFTICCLLGIAWGQKHVRT
ncbi:MAG: hypothetical protein ACJAR1_000597 [Rubritalea sp.]|jgi:hypothetical protein